MSSATDTDASNHDVPSAPNVPAAPNDPTTPITTVSDADERLQVLRLLENDEITADEADQLLDALDAYPSVNRSPSASTPPESGSIADIRPRSNGGKREAPKLRIRVSDTQTGKARVNLTIPLGFLDAAYRLARRVAPGRVPAVEDLQEAVRTGFQGHLIDVVDGNERVEILVE
jgi:hypothetical protein